jgi:hypothetical protein
LVENRNAPNGFNRQTYRSTQRWFFRAMRTRWPKLITAQLSRKTNLLELAVALMSSKEKRE